MVYVKDKFRVAYVMQNVGIDLKKDVGPASLVKQTVRGLRKAGHHVSIISLQNRSVVQINDLNTFDVSRCLPLGLSGSKLLKTIESSIRRLQSVLKIPFFAFFDSYRFYEALLRELPQYAVCHEYGGLFNVGAALACQRRKIPYILTIEADSFLEKIIKGKPLKGFHGGYALWEAKQTFNLANKIITVSEPAKLQLIERYRINPEKIEVVPNGVDVELFHPDLDRKEIRRGLGIDGGPVIGFVGGFQAWHGIDLLIDCFALVVEEYPSSNLLLVGDGPVRPEVERKINQLGLQSRVLLTGLQPRNCIPEMLAAIDVGVIPYPKFSRELWFSPLKLYEYMAAGKAIVASNSGQISEVIHHEHNGLLTEPGNIKELKSAIVRLLKNAGERERLGRIAREQVVARHTWDHYIRHLERIYASAVLDSRNKMNQVN
jgi:glycosyltransferase involved in cell wall biosynthesis